MFTQKFLFIVISILMAVSVVNGQTSPVVYVTWDDISNLNQNDALLLLDPSSLTELDRIPLPGVDPNYLEISSDKTLAFIQSTFFENQPKGMSVISLQQKKVIATLFPNSFVNGLHIGPNNNLYVMLPYEKRMAVIDINNLQEVKSLTVPIGGPQTITFSPDNKVIYLTAEDNPIQNNSDQKLQDYVYIIDSSTLSIKKFIDLNVVNSLGGNDSIVVSPDGKSLYIGLERMVKVVDTNRMEVVSTLPGTRFTYTLLLNKAGDTLYELDFLFGNLQKVNLKNPADVKSTILPAAVRSFKFANNEKILYVGGDSKLFVFDPESFKIIATYEYPKFIFGSDLELTGNFPSSNSPAVSVTSPFSDQVVQKGSPFTIKWSTKTDKFVTVSHSIDLSTDGGKTFKTTIASGLPGTTQEFIWQVPASQNIQQAQIKITSVDASGQLGVGLSSIFSINDKPADTQPPTVNFNSPNGGETFFIGSPLNISWKSQDNVAVTTQDLFLSTDGGTTFPIALATGLAGSIQNFNLTLTDSLKTDRARLKLMVNDAAGNKGMAMTANDFRIAAAPDTQAPVVTISQPSGQPFSAGQPITVQWQSVDNVAVATQSILLSLDGGQSFQTLSMFDGTTNSFVINNIDKFATQAMVKITATDAAGNKGEKTTNFQVAPMLSQATYTKPMLAISGVGFNSAVNGQAVMVKVFINDKEISSKATITVNSNGSINVNGNKMKLGLVKGNNSLRLVVNGLNTNSVNFVF